MASRFAKMHSSLFRHFASGGQLTHDASGVVTPLDIVIKRAIEFDDEFSNLPHHMIIAEFKTSQLPEATRTGDTFVIESGDDAGNYRMGKEVYNNAFVIGREALQQKP